MNDESLHNENPSAFGILISISSIDFESFAPRANSAIVNISSLSHDVGKQTPTCIVRG